MPVGSLASWLGDRCRFAAEESPGSNGSERQVTPGGRELTESAAERKPPMCFVGKGEKVR